MMISSIKKSVLVFAVFLFTTILTSFTAHINILGGDDDNTDLKRLVTLRSDEFNLFAEKVYRQVKFNEDTLNRSVWEKAIRGYMFLRSTDQLNNDRYLTIIDFTKHCNKPRLWIIDLHEKKLLYCERVAHGANTGEEYASSFSNKHSSNKSSLGFYVTGGVYWGRNGLSLKLHGMEKYYNGNAYTRGIVIHGAAYVSDKYLSNNDHIGRSFGCPALNREINEEIVNVLKGGSCLFIYHNTKDYLENSHMVNAGLYIPVDELNL